MRSKIMWEPFNSGKLSLSKRSSLFTVNINKSWNATIQVKYKKSLKRRLKW